MESRDQKDGDEMAHHKLPLYIQNMDRLGDTELWDRNIDVFHWLQLKWLPFKKNVFVLVIVWGCYDSSTLSSNSN